MNEFSGAMFKASIIYEFLPIKKAALEIQRGSHPI